VIILAGRTLGGGTTVNWMTCFRPPQPLLEEWAAVSGIAAFLGPELPASLDAVEQRLHISTAESHLNPNNAALLRGAAALGWHHAIQPRNAWGCGDCGHCAFGCPWGAKQGTRRTYLQDAYDAGAQIVTGATAERVRIDGGRAGGVEARVGPPGALPGRTTAPGSHRLTVRAPLIVVAAGGIESPALLLRSGLRHPQLGRNLYLHPATALIGHFDEEIAPWSGPMQSAHSDQWATPAAGEVGFKFETTPIYPGIAATGLPWDGGRAFKGRMLRIKESVSLLILTRDWAGGRVRLDRWGNPRRGCQEGARLLLAAGAREAFSLQPRPAQIRGPQPTPGAWARYAAALDRGGFGPNQLAVFSAHQMGTCRMAATPPAGVVDGAGAVYGVRGLYVADGSLFPRPSGVNPMVTILGLAHWIGTRLAATGR
jgi:choline dehydrogenase-like flavoprotein